MGLTYLESLCSEDVPNERVRHRELLRGITIHHIQMARLIASLEERNSNTQFWFMVLAISSIFFGAVGSIAQVIGVLRDFGVIG
jgi:hypothetical protein